MAFSTGLGGISQTACPMPLRAARSIGAISLAGSYTKAEPVQKGNFETAVGSYSRHCRSPPAKASAPPRGIDQQRKRHISIQYIQPGKPQQNAYFERYNRTVRHEWLDQHIIESIKEAQDFATEWLWT